MLSRVLTIVFFLCLSQPVLASAFAPLAPNFGLTEAQLDALPRTPDGKYAIYGDVLVRIVEQGELAEVPNIWPGGIFVFSFDASVTAAQRNLFRAACADWTVGTPIVCRERANEKAYFVVHTGSDCGAGAAGCSPVGFQNKVDHMYIHPDFWSSATRTVRHEIGHALGKVHEQSRADRDDYVDIHFERVTAGQAHNFDVVPSARLFTEYDYDSIMHYSNCAFSIFKENCNETTIDRQTIVVRNCARDNAGGATITQLDLDGVRNAYAPQLASLLVRERASLCGVGSFHPEMLDSNEAIFPVGSAAVGWRKTEINYSSTCSFAPVGFGQQCRKPKEFMSTWDDTDKSLNPSCFSKYEVWVECGCKVVTKAMACTNIAKFETTYAGLAVGEKAFHDPEQWRTTRLLYFKAIADELAADNLLTQEVIDFLPSFYQMNYLDRRFETKMFRARAGMYAYAHWKSSVHPGYQLTVDTFRKIATYRKLRIE